IDEASDFRRKIMRDSDDLNWRWKPDGCDLPWHGSKIKAMWMLDVTTPSMESQVSVDFAQLFTKSSLYRSNQDFIKKLSIPPPGLKYLYFRTKYSQPFLTQTKACFLKQYWSNWRHPQYNAIRFLMTILASCWKEQDMNNSFGAMYAAILFLGATNGATVQPLSPLSVLFSTVKKLLECGRGNYVQHGTTEVYALIIYSMIGYDWTVAKSMGSACPSSLVSGISSPVYSDQDRYVAKNDMVEMVLLGIHQWLGRCIIAGVGDMSLKTLLKYGFGFEHDFLPVVAAVHIVPQLSKEREGVIDEASDFQRKIMRDSDDLNWRWKPDGCDLPWCGSKIKAMWMLDVTTPSMESQVSVDFAQLFTNSSLYRSNQEFIKKLSIPPPGLKYLYFRTKYSQPFLTQTKACFLKQYWSNWRHPQYNAIWFLMTILASCWKEQDMNNSFGAMYAAMLFLGATNAATVQPLSPLSVLFSTVKKLLECGRGNYVQHGTTGVYALIIYSMIGYDWTINGICMSFFLSLWNLFSGLLRPRPILLLFVFDYVFAYDIKFLNFQKNVKE
ncbi:hypothetical protein HID58_069626, partial [Brassica napus]